MAHPDRQITQPFVRAFRGLRRGFTTTFVVVAVPALVLMMWFGVELGIVLRAAGHAKQAADAISLAAAARFADGNDAARADALAAAAANRAPNGTLTVSIGPGPGGGGDVEFGDWDEGTRTFTPSADGGTAVRVTVRFVESHPNGAPKTILPGMLGVGSFGIERTSVAIYNPPRYTTGTLLTGSDPASLWLSGSASLVSLDGVSVASGGVPGARVVDDAVVDVPVLRIAGTIDPDTNPAVTGAVEPQSTIADDPFAQVGLPAIDQSAAVAIVHDDAGVTQVLPGVHSGLSALGGRVVLLPGLHQFSGNVLLSGSAVLELSGATMQLVAGATLALDTAASITGTAGSGLPDLPACWVAQRGAPASWSVSGAASISVDGLCYAPDTAFDANGPSSLSTGSAILASLRMDSTSRAEVTEEIDALRMPVIPGRARLVR